MRWLKIFENWYKNVTKFLVADLNGRNRVEKIGSKTPVISDSSLIRSNSPHLNRLTGSQPRLSGSEPRLNGSQPRSTGSLPRLKSESSETGENQPQPESFAQNDLITKNPQHENLQPEHPPSNLEEVNKSNDQIKSNNPTDSQTKKSKKKSKKKKEKKSEELLVTTKTENHEILEKRSDEKASSNSLSGFSEGVGEQRLQDRVEQNLVFKKLF